MYVQLIIEISNKYQGMHHDECIDVKSQDDLTQIWKMKHLQLAERWIYLYKLCQGEFSIWMFFRWFSAWFAYYTYTLRDSYDFQVNTLHFAAFGCDQFTLRRGRQWADWIKGKKLDVRLISHFDEIILYPQKFEVRIVSCGTGDD